MPKVDGASLEEQHPSGMRPLPPFALERYFARHEFSCPYLLCCSDSEPVLMTSLLQLADDECRAAWDGLRLAYTESQGLPALREAVAALYMSVKPDQVVISAPEEGIFLAMQALLQPGDHAVCTAPGYQSLHEIARSIGCEVDLWEPSRQGNTVGCAG